MQNQFSRTEALIGEAGMKRLSQSRVAVFGVGGVGGYAVEALARSGVGQIDLVDSDKVSLTNLNRQIIALHSTLNSYKVDVAAQRINDINPDCNVRGYRVFYSPQTAQLFDFKEYDYIVDAIDTVSSKLLLVKEAARAGVPIISSMGTGNKLDPTAFEVADISKTSVCPLARVMRYELKKLGIKHLKTVYSKEQPIKPQWSGSAEMSGEAKKLPPASCAFVPAAAGLIIAREVVLDLVNCTAAAPIFADNTQL